METKQLEGNGAIKQLMVPSSYALDVTHLGKTITYVLPFSGMGPFKDAAQEIDSRKLFKPTTAQLLSLVDLALQNPQEPYCNKIVKMFRDYFLWAGTEGISFPEGYIVYDNIDGKMPQTSEGLLQLLDAKDSRVRYVKSDFTNGGFRIEELIKHPIVIAHAGEEMIPIIERIAKATNLNTGYVYVLKKAEQDTKQSSEIDGRRSGLAFVGLDGDKFCGGYMPGLLKTE